MELGSAMGNAKGNEMNSSNVVSFNRSQSPLKNPLNNPLVIALDVDSRERALELAALTGDVAGCFKIGPRLVYRYGNSIVEEIRKFAPVFIDCKFFDIPSTMESAVKACFDSGASLCTIHALAGHEALSKLAQLEAQLNQERPFRVLAVTVLTSWSSDSLPQSMKSEPIATHVELLANEVINSGLSGIVCSGEELKMLKSQNKFDHLFKLVPGVRFADDESGDQKRITSPSEAIQNGATALVVGRPIIAHADPKQSALDFSVSIFGAK